MGKVDNSGGELGEFTGTIKSFGFNKNYGFIECDELAEHDGVFLHGDERRGYQLGDKVKFSACLNKDGKPEAYNLKVCGGGGGWGGKQFKVDNSGGELGEFTGIIKSFGFNKNYGFIECDELADY